jgi:hypothetical protein
MAGHGEPEGIALDAAIQAQADERRSVRIVVVSPEVSGIIEIRRGVLTGVALLEDAWTIAPDLVQWHQRRFRLGLREAVEVEREEAGLAVGEGSGAEAAYPDLAERLLENRLARLAQARDNRYVVVPVDAAFGPPADARWELSVVPEDGFARLSVSDLGVAIQYHHEEVSRLLPGIGGWAAEVEVDTEAVVRRGAALDQLPRVCRSLLRTLAGHPSAFAAFSGRIDGWAS